MATHVAGRPLRTGSLRSRNSLAGECPTPAEWDVLTQLVAGQSNAEIACARGRSTATVAKQVAALFRKFGVSSRRALTCRVTQMLPRAPVPPTRTRTNCSVGSLHNEVRLSPREHEIVGLALLGESNKAIAHALGLSPSSVGVFLRRAAVKLAARSTAELIREYQRLRHSRRASAIDSPM
jgi:DNA-binding NarL/FixJ family response regulator